MKIVVVVLLGLVCLLGKNEGKLDVKVNFSREKSVRVFPKIYFLKCGQYLVQHHIKTNSS
jgi:hypothetical protein